MKADIDKRHRAASNYIIKKLSDAMKGEYYDGIKEQFKTHELELFVKSVLDVRMLSKDDAELAAAMANTTIS